MNVKVKDLAGLRFGRLVVAKYAGVDKHRHSIWECTCDCGITKNIGVGPLKSGSTISCGCYVHEVICRNNVINKTKHGMSFTRIYNIWAHMRGRCQNKNNDDYVNYGARGITVCDRWEVFKNFWEDMEEGHSPKLTIDRKDNDGNYSKENCRWATAKEQLNNTRSNRILTFNGLTLTMKQFAEKYNMSAESLWWRLKSGWGIERSLLTPIRAIHYSEL